MSLISWIILGFVTGFVAGKMVNKTDEGFVLDIPLGVVGKRRSGENTYEKIKRKVSTNIRDLPGERVKHGGSSGHKKSLSKAPR